jgi:hypothetical protein
VTASQIKDMDARIIETRKSGKSCDETARVLGIKVWRVWRAMGDAGLKGKVSVYSLDGHSKSKPQRREDSRTMAERDAMLLDCGHLDDIIEWIADIRAGRRPREARIADNFLSRMDWLAARLRERMEV